MQYKAILFIFVLLPFLTTISSASYAAKEHSKQDQSDKELESKSEFLKNYNIVAACIRKKMNELAKNDNSPYQFMADKFDSTDIDSANVFMESMIEKYQYLREIGAERFCKEYLFPKYNDAFAKTHLYLQERDRRTGIKAMLGKREIETDSFFINIYHNSYGKHERGHADLSEIAMKTIQNEILANDCDGFSITECHDRKSKVRDLFMAASQAPDLFQWEAPIYHAHTSEYEPTSSDDRLAKITDSQIKFVRRLNFHISKFQMTSTNGEYQKAIFELGVLAHLLQDLVYHRGMTLRQHAGLSFVWGYTNPDTPDGTNFGEPPDGNSEAEKKEKAAIEYTQQMLRALLYSVNENTRAKVLLYGYVSKASDFRKLAMVAFGSGESKMSIGGLVNYYSLALPYMDGTRDVKKELESGLVVWSHQKMVNNVLSEVVVEK